MRQLKLEYNMPIPAKEEWVLSLAGLCAEHSGKFTKNHIKLTTYYPSFFSHPLQNVMGDNKTTESTSIIHKCNYSPEYVLR